jgi:hypothetical protein
MLFLHMEPDDTNTPQRGLNRGGIIRIGLLSGHQ